MNKRFAGFCLLALGAVALAPSVSRAGGSNYVTTKFVTPSNGIVTYYPATNTFSPSSIVVGGGYVYGDMGFFGTSCYKHDGSAGTPAGVQYSYSGGSQQITVKEDCNINAGVSDLPNPIPATQIFAVPSNITCSNGVASVATFSGTVSIKVAGYAQPMYSGDYGGGSSSITLTANVSCPAVPKCPTGQSTFNYHGDLRLLPPGNDVRRSRQLRDLVPPVVELGSALGLVPMQRHERGARERRVRLPGQPDPDERNLRVWGRLHRDALGRHVHLPGGTHVPGRGHVGELRVPERDHHQRLLEQVRAAAFLPQGGQRRRADLELLHEQVPAAPAGARTLSRRDARNERQRVGARAGSRPLPACGDELRGPWSMGSTGSGSPCDGGVVPESVPSSTAEAGVDSIGSSPCEPGAAPHAADARASASMRQVRARVGVNVKRRGRRFLVFIPPYRSPPPAVA